MTKKIALVTPVHNRRDLTLNCLQSLTRIETEGFETKTYVVDDGSTDGTTEAIEEQYPNVVVVPGDGDLWYTEGVNVGVKEALKWNPDYILLFNDDSVFDSKFLQYLFETAEKHPKTIVGGLLLLWDTPHKVFQVSPQWDMWHGGWRHWQHQTVWTVPEKPWKVDIIVGNTMIVPAEVFKDGGFMDSKRFPMYGDAEFTPRLRKEGWQLLIEPRSRTFCLPNDMPVRIKSLSLKEKYDAMITNRHHDHNLLRRYDACTVGAPSYLNGVGAFLMFLFRVITRSNVENAEWQSEQDEPPLRETFAAAVVE